MLMTMILPLMMVLANDDISIYITDLLRVVII